MSYLPLRSLSLRGRKVKPDILISIHGLAPGSFMRFQNHENISDGVDKFVHGSHGRSITSSKWYFHATG